MANLARAAAAIMRTDRTLSREFRDQVAQMIDVAERERAMCERVVTVARGLELLLNDAERERDRLFEIVRESPEKWGFDTMMWAADRILDEIYPSDIFTGASGDPGPRLVAALRDCRAVMIKRGAGT